MMATNIHTALLSDPALPGIIHSLADPTSRALGALGERLTYSLLKASGYQVSNTHPKEHRGDLRVITCDGEVLHIEVKTARQASDKKWRFTLRKLGHTDHGDSDLVILLCVTRSGYTVPFVIPIEVLRTQNAAVISSDPYTYAGKFSRYRQHMTSLKLEIFGGGQTRTKPHSQIARQAIELKGIKGGK